MQTTVLARIRVQTCEQHARDAVVRAICLGALGRSGSLPGDHLFGSSPSCSVVTASWPSRTWLCATSSPSTSPAGPPWVARRSTPTSSPSSDPSLADLAHVPREPCPGPGLDRLLYRSHCSAAGALCPGRPRSPSAPSPALQRHRASHRCVDRSADRGHFPRRHRPRLSPPRSRRHLRGLLPPTCEGHADPRSLDGSPKPLAESLRRTKDAPGWTNGRSSHRSWETWCQFAESVACIIDTSGERHSHLVRSTSPSPPPRLSSHRLLSPPGGVA